MIGAKNKMSTAKDEGYNDELWYQKRITELEQLLKDAEERASMFEMAGVLQFKEKEKLEQQNKLMLDFLLHLYVNYQMPYGAMDIDIKKEWERIIESVKGQKAKEILK